MASQMPDTSCEMEWVLSDATFKASPLAGASWLTRIIAVATSSTYTKSRSCVPSPMTSSRQGSRARRSIRS